MPRSAGNENRKFCVIRDRVIHRRGMQHRLYVDSEWTSEAGKLRLVAERCISLRGVILEDEVSAAPRGGVGW